MGIKLTSTKNDLPLRGTVGEMLDIGSAEVQGERLG